MNQLSIFLYWAGVAPNLAGLAIFLGILILVISAICFGIMCGFKADDAHVSKFLWPLPFFGLFLSFFLWTGAAFVPPTNTFYAIAASQVGEAALKTPLAGKAGEALTSWIEAQIKRNDATPTPTNTTQ